METNQDFLKNLLANLKKPIPHQWRVQSYSKNKPQATVMAYIDARDAQEALDAYCTYGWHREHYVVDGKVYCKVGIVMPDGSIQWRSDCGTESNQDKEKGQSSDSFKRACVNFGIGRFLYDLEVKYVAANAKKDAGNWPFCIDDQGKQIWDMTKYINNLNPNAPKAPVQVPEPTTEQKVAHMNNTHVNTLSIDELEVIQDSLKLVNNAEELGKYFNSLDKRTQEDVGALSLFGSRKKALLKPQTV